MNSFDSSHTNPASWQKTRETVPEWDWIGSSGAMFVLGALFVPNLVVMIRDPKRTARMQSYSIVVGMFGSVILMTALGFRAHDYKAMPKARRVLFVFYWIVYAMMLLVGVMLMCVKYLYGVPKMHYLGGCDEKSIVGFFS